MNFHLLFIQHILNNDIEVGFFFFLRNPTVDIYRAVSIYSKAEEWHS